MNNRGDYDSIKDQLDLIRSNNTKTQEALSAIQLLMVDNNNGRVKDPRLISELQALTNTINSLSDDISSFSKHFSN
ncbi:hypothetical protein F8154_06080 [Alkaliphilus pronyensis]|uniref:Uncharacterized protein n=1 Tax=Alkaliphilus pronyensis TaxID=1482732 RepID=A0A6I0EZU4_9FIRM|nr:hypothetical protein [Alkaliphilus pronyensis]KAB3535508.1 hypothetical protein F8154_06080 [Alkaliphilus pronyensis]